MGAEKRTQDMLRSTVVDFRRKSAGISVRNSFRNNTVRQIMGVENRSYRIPYHEQTTTLVGQVSKLIEESSPK